MSSIREKAKKIINEHKELFDALEELDRTGKMPELISKKAKHQP